MKTLVVLDILIQALGAFIGISVTVIIAGELIGWWDVL